MSFCRTLLAVAVCCLVIADAFEFDLARGRLFAPSGNDPQALLMAAAEDAEMDDNAGFERPPMFAGGSSSGTRRLIQPPPLKRSHPPRLIRPPPLKRASLPRDMAYRWTEPEAEAVFELVDF
ncbi:hypothetical protein M3Y99_00415200 [Aphelenchoides fujianensis]|nr:hypothetical protein M3Y99_00415200 [Aphelenchoides fujianensis]